MNKMFESGWLLQYDLNEGQMKQAQKMKFMSAWCDKNVKINYPSMPPNWKECSFSV